mmetsp:Transcript_12511/g.37747  ORF Transcript_12511/g.37747 Transcript_12511/m.37747 type:complete len:243 (+) Transcript_12511:229-957(+)
MIRRVVGRRSLRRRVDAEDDVAVDGCEFAEPGPAGGEGLGLESGGEEEAVPGTVEDGEGGVGQESQSFVRGLVAAPALEDRDLGLEEVEEGEVDAVAVVVEGGDVDGPADEARDGRRCVDACLLVRDLAEFDVLVVAAFEVLEVPVLEDESDGHEVLVPSLLAVRRQHVARLVQVRVVDGLEAALQDSHAELVLRRGLVCDLRRRVVGELDAFDAGPSASREVVDEGLVVVEGPAGPGEGRR